MNNNNYTKALAKGIKEEKMVHAVLDYQMQQLEDSIKSNEKLFMIASGTDAETAEAFLEAFLDGDVTLNDMEDFTNGN